MDTVATISTGGVESGLVDVGTLRLAALHQWQRPEVREAMNDVIRQARHSQVYDQQGGGHNTPC